MQQPEAEASANPSPQHIARAAISGFAGLAVPSFVHLLTGALVLLAWRLAAGASRGTGPLPLLAWTVIEVAVLLWVGVAAGRDDRVSVAFVVGPVVMIPVLAALLLIGLLGGGRGGSAIVPSAAGEVALVISFGTARRAARISAAAASA